MKTPERYQLTSLRCLYCKLYTHFTIFLTFVLLTLNMQLFAGQLSSFCERYIEKQPCEKVVALQIRRRMCNINFAFAAHLRSSSLVVKLEAKSCKFAKYWTFYIFSYISFTSSNYCVTSLNDGYFYANR